MISEKSVTIIRVQSALARRDDDEDEGNDCEENGNEKETDVGHPLSHDANQNLERSEGNLVVCNISNDESQHLEGNASNIGQIPDEQTGQDLTTDDKEAQKIRVIKSVRERQYVERHPVTVAAVPHQREEENFFTQCTDCMNGVGNVIALIAEIAGIAIFIIVVVIIVVNFI